MPIAFQFKTGSKMYNAFFALQDEKNRMRELTKRFFDSYFPELKSRGYLITKRLCVQLSDTEREQFSKQLLKKSYHQGEDEFWQFRQNSEMNQKWFGEVYSHINEEAINGFRFWFWDFNILGGGHTEILVDGKDLYGLIIPNHESEKPTIPEWVTLIPLSQYYSISERLEKETHEGTK